MSLRKTFEITYRVGIHDYVDQVRAYSATEAKKSIKRNAGVRLISCKLIKYNYEPRRK